MWILESGIHEILPVESKILGFGIWNTAQGIWNPESKFHWQRGQNPVPGMWNPEFMAWNPKSQTELDSLTGDHTTMQLIKRPAIFPKWYWHKTFCFTFGIHCNRLYFALHSCSWFLSLWFHRWNSRYSRYGTFRSSISSDRSHRLRAFRLLCFGLLWFCRFLLFLFYWFFVHHIFSS